MPYMNQCSSYLQEINIFSIIVRLGMSLIVGGILGTERGLRNRPAGFMTYVLEKIYTLEGIEYVREIS